ncbi:sporulation protein [Bacillus sp. HMF5848]|uniref:sigma-G-dependent sporulation-specific acid-soluble spore protein CsgA n=1 Tax=Bacillus sp. HMF5848 TaxID=2495421 RepID=UPI000F7A91C0|nr:sigma-G-dependent sporulation-specific acid-soluble spore protein CsgA [Bacillus sp. HMF5848]RSK27383.1 sporulation protein [Bacillus sp. HMF5848]
MDKTLLYLREILSNYNETSSLVNGIYDKLSDTFQSEGAFVRTLSEEESQILGDILPKEIKHAMEAQDYKRMHELNEVYELLF